MRITEASSSELIGADSSPTYVVGLYWKNTPDTSETLGAYNVESYLVQSARDVTEVLEWSDRLCKEKGADARSIAVRGGEPDAGILIAGRIPILP